MERKLIEKSPYVDEIMEYIQEKRKKTAADANCLWTPRQTVFIAKLAQDVGLEKAIQIVGEEKA